MAAAAILAALVVVGMLAGDDDKGAEEDEDAAAEVLAVGVTPEEAGCTEVEHSQLPAESAKHVTGTVEWPDEPPNQGDHSPNTLRNVTRFYEREHTPAPEQAVHNLEHGIVVAWYDTELPDEEVEALREAITAYPTPRVMAVPWDRSVFEGGRHVVLTAWGHAQRCARVSGRVVYDFARTYADKDAPEKGYSV